MVTILMMLPKLAILKIMKHVRKSLVLCATQPADSLLSKMLNIFEFSHVKEILES